MLYPNYSAEVAKQAQEQALRTIVDVLVTRNGDYRDIFTAKDTYITPLLASAYGVPFTRKMGRHAQLAACRGCLIPCPGWRPDPDQF